ncbi:hypothetical protein BDN70DRAFT_838433 [Pholiota conissans]|uniref:MYND-type domain-containing protein n=1 Tax=Pholiota conissans TaxID=109636 RepID=A0A9P5YWL0_9AGAR|nr:hypothetical protein BDN70DRAFT_838433 [Pholiota conissans]
MVHPVYWPKKWFFYPIGNTPPVCLTQDLAPEKNAEILLLGCGDPRNILYTVYADLAPDFRPLDVTCCDWEPAILARNILLMTMIVDGTSMEVAWSIFYHFFLDEAAHGFLMAQCRTLVQSSSSMKTWKESKYGHFLRFCNEHSLSEVRRHWVLYSESENDTELERIILRNSFLDSMETTIQLYADKICTFRAAGPLFLNMVSDGHITRSYKNFWTTGIPLSKSSQEIDASYPNPTFAYSVAGKKFNVHYGTDPIMAFYMAPALSLGKGGKPPSSVTTEDLVESAKSQFSAWCSAFKTRLSFDEAARITIRFHVGEALAFSQALHIAKEQKTTKTGIHAQSWGGPPIMLDEEDYGLSSTNPAPLLFNVIETSNLSDHVGVVNLLVATVPILQRKPWSIIHTSTLLRLDPKNLPKSALSNSACGDVPTFSMLLGVIPSPHLWHFTTRSNKHEIIASSAFQGQLHESMSWRFISSYVSTVVLRSQDAEIGHFKFTCNEAQLAKIFMGLYLRMFADENQMRNAKKRGDSETLHKQNIVHYNRASFVAFLDLVKGNVQVDWLRTMVLLIELIQNDHTLMIGMNNYQDLMCNLYLRNVHTLFVHTSKYVESLRKADDRFHGWKDIPPIACVVLKIPRKHLKRIENVDADQIQTPMLQCEVYGPNFHNIYSSIHLTFGDISTSVVNGEPQVTVNQDSKGWNGNSPLIVTFYLPSWTLSNAPTTTQIGLHIRSTPSSQSVALMARLGMRLAIFSTSLTDTAHVHIVRHRPDSPQEISHLRNTPGYSRPHPSAKTTDLTMKFNSSRERAVSLVVRTYITDPDAARALASGSKVSTTPVADSAVMVAFDDHLNHLTYPFPIQTNHLVTRIARKSLYIEVESPIRVDFSDARDISHNPFPLAHDENQINLLNIHYLNLDTLTDLRLPRKERDLEWLSYHATMMFSGPEREARVTLRPEDRGALLNVKETIGSILLKYAGLEIHKPQQWTDVFGLSDPNEYGIYTLIFVNGIKFDESSHTVVIDACIVPLVDGIMSKLLPSLHAISKSGITKVNTLADEMQAWKLLLPVVAERCRTWTHTDTCEYRTQGIPVSLDRIEVNPLCSCGKGKNLGRFGTVAEWAPFYEEATRVAIGPLFTFSFMEDAVKSLTDSLDSVQERYMWKSQCATCGDTGLKLRACAGCMKVRYCSRECQKIQWKFHKAACLAART